MQGTSDIRSSFLQARRVAELKPFPQQTIVRDNSPGYPEALPIVLNGITILQTKRDPFNHKHPFEARLNKYLCIKLVL